MVGTPQDLGSKTTTAGVFDAADSTFTAVSGATVEAIIYYRSTGTDSTSPVLMVDNGATGLPVTPNGGDITITYSAGINRIFRLVSS